MSCLKGAVLIGLYLGVTTITVSAVHANHSLSERHLGSINSVTIRKRIAQRAEPTNQKVDEKVACHDMGDIPANVKCMFINLDSRSDRRARFEKEMGKHLEPFQRCLGWSLERIPAIQADKSQGDGKHPGQIAAARSHVSALKKSLSSADSPVLIFEDDYGFQLPPAQLVQRLTTAFDATKGKWDVMMLGDNSYQEGDSDIDESKGIGNTKGAWCSEAYLVAPTYKKKLLDEVTKGLSLMEAGHTYVHEGVEPLGAAYDTLWYPLQQKDNWLIFRPKLGEQANTWGDSNIG